MNRHHHAPVAIGNPSKNPPAAVKGDVSVEVADLIAAGKCKQAVEQAKEHHKRTNTPESQQLLVNAYVSRISQFQEKGQAEDARTLIKLVKDRFPAHVDRLAALEVTTAASGGLIDELVAALARADLPESQRQMIESAVRQQMLDLNGLAAAKTLPDSHPLKLAAAAVVRAFAAATSGPVTDEQITLPEVSRKSPLAGWRMLIRAIALLHRNDDEGSRRALEAITPDAAVAKLVPVVLGIIDSAPADGGAIGALQKRIANDASPLKDAISALDGAFMSKELDRLVPAVVNVLRATEQAWPQRLESVRQRLMVRCIVELVPLVEINKFLGTTVRSAAFWRLLARGYEQVSAYPMAALAWERFICHAIDEKIFTANSIEQAIVHAHMATFLSSGPMGLSESFARLKQETSANFYRGLYQNQPPHIAALVPKNPADVVNWVLSPDALFRKATTILPDGDTFRAWADWAVRGEQGVKFQEDICLAWQRALPRDPEPPLRLSQMAEERNALSMALKRLAEAEAIDAFNPAVRKARRRLTIATFWKHMKDRKPHLAEKDLAELDGMDGFLEGDLNAFLWAARCAWHRLREDSESAADAANRVVEKMGPLAAGVLLASVAMESHVDRTGKFALVPEVANPSPVAAAQADARLARLTKEISLTLCRSRRWTELERQVLQEVPCPLSRDDILLIGNLQLTLNHAEVAYSASSAGLCQTNGAESARFLLLRARALSGHAWGRAAQCLAAARELARQVHDPDLLGEITGEMSRNRHYGGAGDGKPLDSDILTRILSAERDARKFPSGFGGDKHLVYIEQESGFGRGGFGDMDFMDEDEDDDDDEDEFLGDNQGLLPFDLDDPERDSSSVPPALAKVFKKYGKLPSVQEMMNNEPELVEEMSQFLNEMMRKGRR